MISRYNWSKWPVQSSKKERRQTLRGEGDKINFIDRRFEEGKLHHSEEEEEGKMFHKLRVLGMNDD